MTLRLAELRNGSGQRRQIAAATRRIRTGDWTFWVPRSTDYGTETQDISTPTSKPKLFVPAPAEAYA